MPILVKKEIKAGDSKYFGNTLPKEVILLNRDFYYWPKRHCYAGKNLDLGRMAMGSLTNSDQTSWIYLIIKRVSSFIVYL